MDIHEITLRSWNELQDHYKRGWIYRGQSDTCWPLKTSLERYCENRMIPPRSRYDFEDRLFREFRRAYHQFASRLPPSEWRLEWFSIMQHHGAPTRLVDFTYSIYVAAYFALEHAFGDSAVWGVDAVWADKESLANLARNGKDVSSLPNLFSEAEEARVSELLFKPPQTLMAAPLTPFYLNERLRLQKGTFLAPGDVSGTFMDNLAALHYSGRRTMKLRIPESLRVEGLRHLFHMNISRTTLFPGLDGYAQSLGVYHPTVDDPIQYHRRQQ